MTWPLPPTLRHMIDKVLAFKIGEMVGKSDDYKAGYRQGFEDATTTYLEKTMEHEILYGKDRRQ